MNITSAQYKVDLDGATKVAIHEWVAEGNTIKEAD